MRKLQGNPTFSPSDLITFMESEYAGWMDRFHLEFPDAVQPDQDTAEDRILQARGEEHERTFLCELADSGHDVCDLKGATDLNAAFEAMRTGREIIYQAALASGCFAGIADFLVRVEGHSALGNHYSVARQQGVWKSDADTVLVEIDSNPFFKPHSKMLRSPHAYTHWRGNPLVST